MTIFPNDPKTIYLMAICGTGMASLAGLLKTRGFEICGSDTNTYPPMSDELKKQGIPIFTPYSENNLKKTRPDLVIVGNAISKTNPEASFLLQSDIPYVSMPQALNEFFLKDKTVIVVSGTHGKTTTTTLLAYLLKSLGLDPGYLIGGVSQDFQKSFHVGKDPLFVIEGDEYDTAFFDKGPKFLHYNPTHVIMTSLEFDHADIYRDLEHVTSSFEKLAKIIPEKGSLHYCADYPSLKKIAGQTSAKVFSYSLENVPSSSLYGRHNAMNTTACFSVLKTMGFDLSKAKKALKNFRGVKRRQEILYEDENLIVIDDFAHHPTAVKETIAAVKDKYPNRYVIAVFEPRSNTSIRNIFQKEYTKSFLVADETVLAKVFKPEKVADGQILNVPQIVVDLKAQGRAAFRFDTTQEIINHILKHPSPRKVILIMSNGGFENVHQRLIRGWKK